jgi:hypothetical protein
MTSDISPESRLIVATRANHVCEYCLVAQEDAYFTLQIEHIISRKHGGSSDVDNLALACVFCNAPKGTDIGTIVPGRTELVRLYHPRNDRWPNHFHLNGPIIEPVSEMGEATIRILQMNHDDRVPERDILTKGGHYPSPRALLLITEH